MSIQTEIRRKFKSRSKHSHKGDYGRVFIVAGSKPYPGAAYLTGLAALRSGAGLVTLGVPDSIHAIVARRQPELIVVPLPSTKNGTLSDKALPQILEISKEQDVIALGPGLSQNAETQRFVRVFLRQIAPTSFLPRKKTGEDKRRGTPLVVDADGLNALQGDLSVFQSIKERCILTPHPGEFLRLFGGKLSGRDEDRKKRALEAARKYKLTVVLKGHHTVVAEPSGKIYVNKTGNPGMATAGSGDVLTGIIAAFLGQKLSLWDASRFAVYLHGLAGDLAARKLGERSLIAGDLIDFLPQAFHASSLR